MGYLKLSCGFLGLYQFIAKPTIVINIILVLLVEIIKS